ncbi:kinase-like domain-containing protein [Infundibulicybe gibba]|nr:kinase-like domain-containing protein [Infundibulicybe gibba]
MFFNNINTLVNQANNGAVTSSLDSNASVYSCGPYKGSQELTTRPCMSINDLDILTEISTGDTSTTYLVKHKMLGKLYALKVAPKAGLSDVEVKYILEQQAVHVAIERVAGNFLLPLVASWHDERNFYLVTDYIRGGDLATEVVRCGSFGAARARCYAAELVLALESLHKLNIIHRGVTANNILLDAAGHITLRDYGFSKRFDEPGFMALTADSGSVNFAVDPDCDRGAFFASPMEMEATTCEVTGIPYAMSPEQHYGCEYSYDADVWALGVMLYLMLVGSLPFGKDSKNIEELRHEIAYAPLVFPEGTGVDPITANLLSGLLAKDRRDRLTIPQVKAHEYFKNIDWFKVESKEYLIPWRPLISPIPKVAQDTSLLIAGTSYPSSVDPYPEFQFLAVHVAPAEPEVSSPASAPKMSAGFMECLSGKLSAALPSCGLVQSFAPAPRKSGLRPLILPKILARRTLEAQSLGASSHGYLSPSSPPVAWSARSSSCDSLFSAASRSTTPTTISSCSPSPLPEPGFSGAPKEINCASLFPPPAFPAPACLTPIVVCPVTVSAGLRLRVAARSARFNTPKSQGLGIFNFTPTPLSHGPVLQNTRHKHSAALVPAPIPEVPQVPPTAQTKARRATPAAEPTAPVLPAEAFELESAAAGQAPREIALGVEAPHENVIARTRACMWHAQDEAWGIPAIEVDRICLGSAWSADTIPELATEGEEDEQEEVEDKGKGVWHAMWGWATGLCARAPRIVAA